MQEKNKLHVVNLTPSCWEYASSFNKRQIIYAWFILHVKVLILHLQLLLLPPFPCTLKYIRSNQRMPRVVDNSSQDIFRNLDVLISYLYKMTHNLNQKITINQPSQDLVNCSNTSSWPTRNFPWPSIPRTEGLQLLVLHSHGAGSCGHTVAGAADFMARRGWPQDGGAKERSRWRDIVYIYIYVIIILYRTCRYVYAVCVYIYIPTKDSEYIINYSSSW